MEIPEALTFDDVLLEPRHSSVLPKETIVSTQLSLSVTLGIPLIASAMDTVSEYKLAIAMAQSGGMACIHKNMSIEDQANQIKLVKRFESGMVIDPITIDAEASLLEATELMKNHKISGILVVNKNFKLVYGDITDAIFMTSLISDIKPDRFFSLAAQSHVGYSFSNPYATFEADACSVVHTLSALQKYSPSTRFYQASTSELFGGLNCPEAGYTEDSKFHPRSQSKFARLRELSLHLKLASNEAHSHPTSWSTTWPK